MTLPKQAIKGNPIMFEVVTTLDSAASNLSLTYYAISVNKKEIITSTSSPADGISLTNYAITGGSHVYTWECLISPQKTSNLDSDVFFTTCQLFIGTNTVTLEDQVLVLGNPLTLVSSR